MGRGIYQIPYTGNSRVLVEPRSTGSSSGAAPLNGGSVRVGSVCVVEATAGANRGRNHGRKRPLVGRPDRRLCRRTRPTAGPPRVAGAVCCEHRVYQTCRPERTKLGRFPSSWMATTSQRRFNPSLAIHD